MKKNIILTVLVFLLAATAVFAQGGKEADDGQFHIKGNVDFYVSSSSGGGSDIITRTITDIASKNGIVDAPFIVYNQPDGNGQISRRTVSTARNADSTLLCFSSGDLTAMIQNGGLTLDDFRPLVILAADKHLCFVNADGKYSSFEEIMEAVKNGQKINVGGTMSDERVVFNMLCEELGTKDSSQLSSATMSISLSRSRLLLTSTSLLEISFLFLLSARQDSQHLSMQLLHSASLDTTMSSIRCGAVSSVLRTCLMKQSLSGQMLSRRSPRLRNGRRTTLRGISSFPSTWDQKRPALSCMRLRQQLRLRTDRDVLMAEGA